MAPEGVAQKFRNKGWIIGVRDGRDICPKCQERRRKHRASNLEKQANNMINMPIIKAELPREMSRDDRRVIFAKLNDVYIDETKGYDNGWTDQRVATDLGVPLAWVKAIREENFGLEPANEDTRMIVNEARKLLEEINEKQKQIDEAARQFKRMFDCSEIVGKADEIAKKLDKLGSVIGLK